MENNINGKELNKKFINAIKNRRKKLFESAKPFIETSNADEVVEKIDDTNYIKKEDKEEYDILMTLLTYVEFDKHPAEDAYEFKGLEYKSGKRSYKTSIVVSKENALKISKLANDYEDKLKRNNSNPDDKKMSIKFPVELLLLKYKGTNMPGLDYEAPEPKTAAQTNEEYEAGLESYYGAHGVNKTNNDLNGFREAYPHEKVNYRQDPPVMSNVVQSGYYDEAVRELTAQDLGAEHGEPGLEPGEEQPITGTDRGLGRRIGDGLLNLKNLFKSDTIGKKICKGAVIAGLGYTAVSCLLANPGVTLMIAGGVVAVGATAGFIFPKFKKGYCAIKKKIKEWLFGPQLTNEPQGGGNGGNGGNGGGNTGGNDPEPDPVEPTMTAEEITNRIAELDAEITTIEREIAGLNAEIDALAADAPERAAKVADRDAKRIEYRTKLNEITALLHRHDVEHSRGGRGAR